MKIKINSSINIIARSVIYLKINYMEKTICGGGGVGQGREGQL